MLLSNWALQLGVLNQTVQASCEHFPTPIVRVPSTLDLQWLSRQVKCFTNKQQSKNLQNFIYIPDTLIYMNFIKFSREIWNEFCTCFKVELTVLRKFGVPDFQYHHELRNWKLPRL